MLPFFFYIILYCMENQVFSFHVILRGKHSIMRCTRLQKLLKFHFYFYQYKYIAYHDSNKCIHLQSQSYKLKPFSEGKYVIYQSLVLGIIYPVDITCALGCHFLHCFRKYRVFPDISINCASHYLSQK